MDSADKTPVGSLPDDHTRQIYESLPEEQKQKQTYTEWLKELYNDQYQKWMPWIEDLYLRWFGKGDNKASYVTKDTLSKSKVTGINQVDQLQDDVHNLVGNQVGDQGLLAPVGNASSKHGINRAERGGKDEDGLYGGPAAPITDKGIDAAKNVGSSVAAGAKSIRGAFTR
ncbi:hypothetical protein BJX96DRAFT_170799 [Aspergillus floccosus]